MSIVAVAKKAGVSIATVSRVLNKVPVVNQKTVDQVHRAVAETGYRPTRVRRNTGGTKNRGMANQLAGRQIAVLAIGGDQHWLRMPVMASVLTGISQGAREIDLRLILEEVNLASPLAPQAQRFREMAGAIAFVTPHVSDEILQNFTRHLPLVWVMGGEPHHTIVDHVSADNVGIGYIAFESLVQAGCEHFAYITDTPDWPVMRARGQAFANAANDSGKAVTSFLVTEDHVLVNGYGGNAHAAGSLEGCVDLFSRKRAGRTGLFVPTDLLTARIYPMLAERGIRPGGDIQIISCDNEDVRLASLSPRPRSIDLRPEEIGRAAVRQLISRISSPDAPIVRVQVSPKLDAVAGDVVRI